MSTEIPNFIEQKMDKNWNPEFIANKDLIESTLWISQQINDKIYSQINKLNDNPNITPEDLKEINKVILEASKEFEKYMTWETTNLSKINEKMNLLDNLKIIKPILKNPTKKIENSTQQLTQSEKYLKQYEETWTAPQTSYF